MRSPFGNSEIISKELQGRFADGRPKLVTRKFGAIAKLLWPHKTAAHIAAIAGRDERTAKRWLSGEFDPPMIVVVATMKEIFVNE